MSLDLIDVRRENEISVALDDELWEVYIKPTKNSATKYKVEGKIWSLKSKGKYQAIGYNSWVELYFNKQQLVGESCNYWVTALEFWGSAGLFFAASSEVIQLFDHRNRDPEVCSFKSPGTVAPTGVKLQGSTLACSGIGYNEIGSINLWDIRYSGQRSLWNLKQNAVYCMDFCPLERQLLATGGEEGINVWDTVSGTMKVTISMPDADVTSLLWSPFRKEILFSNKNFLSLASFSSNEGHVFAKWNHSKNHNAINAYDEIMSLQSLQNGKVISIDVDGMLCEHYAFLDHGQSSIRPSKNTQSLMNPKLSSVIR